jgi:capsular exopolysaccharide synthesis family protein
LKQQKNARTWLEKQIKGEYTGEILNISMDGDHPEGLATIVNGVVESYLNEVVSAEVKERRKWYKRLQDIYRTYQNKLKTQRQTLETLGKRIGSTDRANVQLTHALAIENRTLMERDLRQLRNELRRAETELAVKRQSHDRSSTAPVVSAAAIEDALGEDNLVQEYEARIAKQKGTVVTFRSKAKKANDPALARAQLELDNSIRALQERKAKLRPMIVARLQPSSNSAQQSELTTLEDQVKLFTELVSLAAEDVKLLGEETGAMNQDSLTMDEVQSEIVLTEAAAKRVGNEVEALGIELNAPSRVKLIESASTPGLEADKRPRTAGMAGLGALSLVLLGISFAEFRARRVASVDDVVEGLGIGLVGTLPVVPFRSAKQIGVRKAPRERCWQQHLTESVANTRTNLLYAMANNDHRAVMVTSAVGGEGKTLLSCTLSTSIARTGRKTLLIGGDLRRPDAHVLLDLPLAPGFCEVLRGQVALADAIQPTSMSGLWMITAGECDETALLALAQRNLLGEIFTQLREQFDMIVVDTSPVLAVSDALLIGQQMDAAICSVLVGVSRLPQVHAAHERLLGLGIKILGAVMAGVREEVYAGHYSYGYSRPA